MSNRILLRFRREEMSAVRKNPHGSNEYKAGYVNNREYKDHNMFFMIPSEKGYEHAMCMHAPARHHHQNISQPALR